MGSGPSTYKRRRTKFSISCGRRQPLEVNFDDFQILRAIGKGSFGKVCIVQKKDTMKMYAMKYMNKIQCIEKDAFKNVLKEIEILCSLEHPFIVNLWFTFQDEEDMFMVVDLLLGGDLRYHLQQSNSHFSEERVALYICEIALALDYLRSKRIIHRDIKPDNILLDDCGHAHITDFNVAIVVKEGEVANSVTGTKPYMAPEVTMCSRDLSLGYSYAADWWSLGITAYELLCRKRPYDIRSDTSMEDIEEMILNTCLRLSQSFDQEFTQLINEMLCPDPEKRISSVDQLRAHCYLRSTDFTAVLNGQVTPSFVPNKKQLNCDPTFELEEMIIEAKPLHKKKKRLSKRNRTRTSLAPEDSEVLQMHLNSIQEKFTIYNRERELQKRAMEAKEKDWEEEMKKVIS